MGTRESGLKNRIITEKPGWALSLSPGKMAVIITLVIFLVELFVMILLDQLPSFSPLVEAVIDSTFLIAFLAPIYIALYRPFWLARQRAQDEIQKLNYRLTAASEDEKQRIALDLHDHCDQTLVALQRTVELVQSKVIDTSEEAAVLCQEIDELLGRLNHDVRTVSSALHPPQLDNEGLGPALKRHLEQVRLKANGTSVEYIEKGDVRSVDSQKAVAIYRIVQEALNNAMQHAFPSLVRVYLEYASDAVSVSIVDDGKGFNSKDAAVSNGIGLTSMRERARAHQGTLLVYSEEGRGTSLRANFKL